jgi:triosephosphate isomerase
MNQPLSDILIMTPFNSIGFQMNPSRESCETCLSRMSDANVIAMSILAGGYISLNDAVTYVRHCSGISGVAVGVSSLDHAENTFRKLQELASA